MNSVSNTRFHSSYLSWYGQGNYVNKINRRLEYGFTQTLHISKRHFIHFLEQEYGMIYKSLVCVHTWMSGGTVWCGMWCGVYWESSSCHLGAVATLGRLWAGWVRTMPIFISELRARAEDEIRRSWNQSINQSIRSTVTIGKQKRYTQTVGTRSDDHRHTFWLGIRVIRKPFLSPHRIWLGKTCPPNHIF